MYVRRRNYPVSGNNDNARTLDDGRHHVTSAGCGPVTAVVVQPGKFHLSKDISRLCLFSRGASGGSVW